MRFVLLKFRNMYTYVEREKYLFIFTYKLHIKFINLTLNTAVFIHVKKDFYGAPKR